MLQVRDLLHLRRRAPSVAPNYKKNVYLHCLVESRESGPLTQKNEEFRYRGSTRLGCSFPKSAGNTMIFSASFMFVHVKSGKEGKKRNINFFVSANCSCGTENFTAKNAGSARPERNSTYYQTIKRSQVIPATSLITLLLKWK